MLPNHVKLPTELKYFARPFLDSIKNEKPRALPAKTADRLSPPSQHSRRIFTLLLFTHLGHGGTRHELLVAGVSEGVNWALRVGRVLIVVNVKHPEVGPIHINHRVLSRDLREVGGHVVCPRGGECETARSKEVVRGENLFACV